MSPWKKIQEGLFEHIGTAAALAVTSLIGWTSLQIAPLIAPAIESALPIRAILGILGLSLILNIGLAIAVWQLSSTKRFSLRLKYGILWDRDKNPHCPVCKNAGLDYGEWSYGQCGYFCNNCDKVYSLQDSSGKKVTPPDAIKLL